MERRKYDLRWKGNRACQSSTMWYDGVNAKLKIITTARQLGDSVNRALDLE